MKAKTILFACIHNAGRSQMATAFLNAMADPLEARGVSAGTEPGERVHPAVVIAMKEAGFDLSGVRPQPLTPKLQAETDFLITMGCGEACPTIPAVRRMDWALADPKGQPIERVRAIRDEIERRVAELIREKRWRR
jgi:arsenate reductase